MAEKTFSPVRARAASVEAALAQALQMTGASREEIEFEVLEETEKGAVVRIAPIGTLAPKTEAVAQAPSTPVEEAVAKAVEVDFEEEKVVEEAPVLFEDKAAEKDEEVQALEIDATNSIESGSLENETIENESHELLEAAEQSTPVAAEPEGATPAIRAASPAVMEHARVLAQEMLDRMTLEAEAKIAELPAWCLPTSHDKSSRVRDVPRAFLQIEGEDVGVLIGKHGQTLQSFQYLLNLSLNNTSEAEEASEDGVRNGGVHVIVDAGDYRGRRAEALERAAHEAAERAKRDRRAIRMEPMPGHERRLVHLALYEDKEITTSSDGREPWRRVVVMPAGMQPTRGGDDRGGERSGGYNRSGRGSGGNQGSGNRSGGGERSGGYGSSREGNRGGGRSGGYGSSADSAGGGRRSYN